LIAAWLFTPLSVAWTNEKFELNNKIVIFLKDLMPDSLQNSITQLDSVVTSLQQLKNLLFSLSIPEKIAAYLESPTKESDSIWQAEQTLDMMMDNMLGNIAKAVVTAVVFLLIYKIVSFIIKNFLGLFTGSKSIFLFGTIDAVLGMTFNTALALLLLTVAIGALYPMIMVKAMEENGSSIFKIILDSFTAPRLNSLYLQYLLPWFS